MNKKEALEELYNLICDWYNLGMVYEEEMDKVDDYFKIITSD